MFYTYGSNLARPAPDVLAVLTQSTPPLMDPLIGYTLIAPKAQLTGTRPIKCHSDRPTAVIFVPVHRFEPLETTSELETCEIGVFDDAETI